MQTPHLEQSLHYIFFFFLILVHRYNNKEWMAAAAAAAHREAERQKTTFCFSTDGQTHRRSNKFTHLQLIS